MKKVRSIDEPGLRAATLGSTMASPIPGGGYGGHHTGSLRLSDVRAGLVTSNSLYGDRVTAAGSIRHHRRTHHQHHDANRDEGALSTSKTRDPLFYGSTGRMAAASATNNMGASGAAAGGAGTPIRYPFDYSAERGSSSISSLTSEDRGRRRSVRLLLNSETCFAGLMQFGVERYVSTSHLSAKVLSPPDHKTMFQNAEQFPPLSHDLCQMIREDLLKSGGRKVGIILHSEIDRICRTYKSYCLGLKQADSVLAKKLRDRKFIKFLEDPPIPKRKPDITTFIHKPFEHLRRLLLSLLCIQRFTTNQHEDWVLLQASIHKLRECYKEINMKTGLMEPPSSIKHKTLPFLSIEDLESRLVFINTLQPFKLGIPGRKWIFGGQLWKLSGRQGAKDYWAMLFSDVLVLTQVNRDRVIFVMEEPILLSQVSDVIFSKKKKSLTFRLVLDPKPVVDKNGLFSSGGSQGASCLHWSRKAKKVVILKAPSAELKSMWQNLLERQMFYVRNPHMSTSYSVQSLASSLRSFSLENLSSELPSPADDQYSSLLDNSGGSLSQPSSPKHSIRFQRPYAVPSPSDSAGKNGAGNNGGGSHHAAQPPSSPSLTRSILPARAGSKIHAKPTNQPPAVNGLSQHVMPASASVSTGGSASTASSVTSSSPPNSSSADRASNGTTGSTRAGDESKEYMRIAQLLNIDPSRLGNLIHFGSSSSSINSSGGNNNNNNNRESTGSNASNNGNNGKTKHGSWKSTLKEKFSRYASSHSKLSSNVENNNPSPAPAPDIEMPPKTAGPPTASTADNNNGDDAQQPIYDTAPGAPTALSKADLLSVEHFLDLLCQGAADNNKASSGSSEQMNYGSYLLLGTPEVRPRKNKLTSKPMHSSKLDALSVIEECSSSDPELSSLHSFCDGRGEAKASKEEAGIKAATNRGLNGGAAGADGNTSSNESQQGNANVASSNNNKNNQTNNNSRSSEDENISPKIENRSPYRHNRRVRVTNGSSSSQPNNNGVSPLLMDNTINGSTKPVNSRPFTCTHSLPVKYGSGSHVFRKHSSLPAGGSPRSLAQYGRSPHLRHTCGLETKTGDDAVTINSNNSPGSGGKKPSEPFESYVDGCIEKDYPELANSRSRRKRRLWRHQNRHRNKPATIMEQREKEESYGKCESTVTTVKQPDRFLRKWTEKMRNRPLPPPSDILLTGSPSMQFADESGSDPSTLGGGGGWTSSRDAESDKNCTTSEFSTATSSRSEGDDEEDACEEEDDDEEGETGFEDGDLAAVSETIRTIGVRGSTSSFLNFSSISSDPSGSLPGADDQQQSSCAVQQLLVELLPQISIMPPTPQTFSPASEDPCEWDVSDLRGAEMDILLHAANGAFGSDDDLTPAIDETEFSSAGRAISRSDGVNDLNQLTRKGSADGGDDETQDDDGYGIHRFSTLEDLQNLLIAGGDESNLTKMEPSMRHSTSGELQTLTAVRFLSNRYLLTKRSMSLDTFHVVSRKWPQALRHNNKRGSSGSIVDGADAGAENDDPNKQQQQSASASVSLHQKRKTFQAAFLNSTCGPKHSTISKWLDGKLSTGFPRTNPYVTRKKHYLSPETCRYMTNPRKGAMPAEDLLEIVKEESPECSPAKSSGQKNIAISDGADGVDSSTGDGETNNSPQKHSKKKGFAAFFWHRHGKKASSQERQGKNGKTLAHLESVGTSSSASSANSSPTPNDRIPLWSRLSSGNQKKKLDSLAGKTAVSPSSYHKPNGFGNQGNRTPSKHHDEEDEYKGAKEGSKRETPISPPPYCETPDSQIITEKAAPAANVATSSSSPPSPTTTAASPSQQGTKKKASINPGTVTPTPASEKSPAATTTSTKTTPSKTATPSKTSSIDKESNNKPAKTRKFLIFSSSKSKEQKALAKESKRSKQEENIPTINTTAKQLDTAIVKKSTSASTETSKASGKNKESAKEKSISIDEKAAEDRANSAEKGVVKEPSLDIADDERKEINIIGDEVPKESPPSPDSNLPDDPKKELSTPTITDTKTSNAEQTAA